ncbi:MAG: hypothetical protein ABF651_03685 [Sporolactobacillus sp.]
MNTLAIDDSRCALMDPSRHQKIPWRKGDDRMLHLNLFALHVTFSIRRISAEQRYQDLRRINELTDKTLDQKIVYSRRLW